MAATETGGTVQPVEVGSDVTRDPRPAFDSIRGTLTPEEFRDYLEEFTPEGGPRPVHTLLGALDAFEREFVPSGLVETHEWKRVRRLANQANHTMRIAAAALRDEGHLTLAAETEVQVSA